MKNKKKWIIKEEKLVGWFSSLIMDKIINESKGINNKIVKNNR